MTQIEEDVLIGEMLTTVMLNDRQNEYLRDSMNVCFRYQKSEHQKLLTKLRKAIEEKTSVACHGILRCYHQEMQDAKYKVLESVLRTFDNIVGVENPDEHKNKKVSLSIIVTEDIKEGTSVVIETCKKGFFLRKVTKADRDTKRSPITIE